MEEFDDIFSIMLRDVEAHFKMFDTFGRGRLNVFEVFAGAYMFSQESLHGLDAKIESCFELFDFDGSGSLNEVELELMFEAVLMGMSKISKIVLPYSTVVTEYVGEIFDDLHKNKESDSVSLGELKQWVSEQKQILDFFSHFMDARLIIQMKQKVEAALEKALKKFKEAAIAEGASDGKGLSLEGTKKLLNEVEGTPPTEAEIKALSDLLASVGASPQVSEAQFIVTIEPWLAFGVLDEDGSRTLDVEELKALMWIAEGIDTPEPFEKAVTSAMVEMDVDDSKTVDRLEWIQYNCIFDPTTGCVRPAKQLKADFEELDTDGSGNISAIEMEQIIRKALDDIIKKAMEEGRTLSQSSQNILKTMVNNSSNELIDLLDSSGNGMVEWNEFRVHQTIVSEKVKEIRDFVMHLVDQDEAEGITKFEQQKEAERRKEQEAAAEQELVDNIVKKGESQKRSTLRGSMRGSFKGRETSPSPARTTIKSTKRGKKSSKKSTMKSTKTQKTKS
mmetsp:Transcript_23778/g.30808  ORF Transcript_23778/g.30808 Transcript_23778/m.30808 type:complete len:504 (-) Transcript_23778:285-1796(-)